MDKEKITAGVAWLEKFAAGEATGSDVSPDALQELVSFARARLVTFDADKARDPNEPIPETVVVKLRHPLVRTAGAGELRQIEFRTPSWAELKQLHRIAQNKGKAAGEIAAQDAAFDLLALKEQDLTPPDFDRLKAIDAQRIAEALAPFMALET